jgi:hypothetical protein
MTEAYRALSPGARREVLDHVLWRPRCLAPLLVVAVLAAMYVALRAVKSRASLHIEALAASVARRALPRPSLLGAPATHGVAAYTWSLGAGILGDVERRELPTWYGDAHVDGTRVVLSGPMEQSIGLIPSFTGTFLGALEPDTFCIGLSDGGPQNDEAARAISAWMHGAHEQPLEVAWTSTPPPYASVGMVLAALAATALLLRRSRLRVVADGAHLSVEQRGLLSTSRCIFARAEVRTVMVDSRPMGPITLARPVVVTSDRRVPLGPLALRLVEAAALAGRIREILA